MALTSDQITAQNFKDFYGQIRPYLNGSAHAGFTPVGTVISVMGKQAPLNYLVCDGTVYNIKDYPELAAYFAGQFEVSNFFGGDGTITFAVPDLRGEFLRGSGTNSHENQGNGANVGVHQDATEHVGIYGWDKTIGVNTTGISGNRASSKNYDKTIKARTSSLGNTMIEYSQQSNDASVFTSRPTNTSVLYCIATKNIFVDEGDEYSTEERVIGTWINGKPLYQKTLIFNNPSTDWGTFTNWGIANISQVIEVKPVYNFGTWHTTSEFYYTSSEFLQALYQGYGFRLYAAGDVKRQLKSVTITLKYTKTTD